jgi:hypothetical protein
MSRDKIQVPRQRALRLHPNDNVCVVLENAEPGPVELLGDSAAQAVDAVERITSGHKLALNPIDMGEPVIKYGVTIGLASEPIAKGAWVHTHNCRSRLDQRSHTLDRHTGAPTDTQYV